MRSPQRLDEVCDITMGQAPEGLSYNIDGDGLPLIAGAGDFGERHPIAKKFTSNPGKVCEAGDIILGIRASIGDKVVADRAYCLGRGVAGLRAKPALDSRYLWHWLTHAAPVLTAKAKGATFKQVNREDIQELSISPPPLYQQRRIAEILDKADALRAKRRAALAQLDTLTQSIFLDMFGDPATNPKGWPMRTLHELGAEFRYGTSVKSSSAGEPSLRIPNVVGGSIDLSDLKLVPVGEVEFQRLRLRDGDLLFVRTNGNPDFVGRCAVFDSRDVGSSGHETDRFIYASYLIRARFAYEAVEPVFLREYLLGTEGRRRLRARCKTSAGQYNINTEGLGAIAVPRPALGVQKAFAERIGAVERIRAENRAAIDQVDSLVAALQHRAFRGEL